MRTEEDLTSGFDRLSVADVMERHVPYGHRNTRADVLASLVIEDLGAVPIVDSGQRLVGIVTEFDLLAALDKGKELSDLLAQEIMTRDPVRVVPDTEVATLMYVLQTNHLIRVPVVDREGKLVGIVGRRDVLRAYLAAEPEVVAAGTGVIGYW